MVFVFGSNLAGVHGRGAAYHAKLKHGAVYGVGEGLTGNSYALPTKDNNIKVRPWADVCKSIDTFLSFSLSYEDTFLLTPVGCGLAGFKARDVWSYIKEQGLPNNVYLSSSWVNEHNLVGE